MKKHQKQHECKKKLQDNNQAVSWSKQ